MARRENPHWWSYGKDELLLTCRFATPRDVGDLLELDRSRPLLPHLEELELRDALLDQKRRVTIVQKQNEIVGYCLGHHHGNRYSIDRLVVDREHERLGIGTKMVDYAAAFTRSQVCRKLLEAIVSERNLPALNFFKANQFKAERVLWGYCEDCDAILMRRWI